MRDRTRSARSIFLLSQRLLRKAGTTFSRVALGARGPKERDCAAQDTARGEMAEQGAIPEVILHFSPRTALSAGYAGDQLPDREWPDRQNEGCSHGLLSLRGPGPLRDRSL